MAAKRKTTKAPVPAQATGPLPSDLRYSELDQPSILRPMGTGAAIGAGLVGTLGGFFTHKKISKPFILKAERRLADAVADVEAAHASETWRRARAAIGWEGRPFQQSEALFAAHDATRPQNYYSFDPEHAQHWKDRYTTELGKERKAAYAITAGATVGGGLLGTIVGAIPGFAHGMKKEREYEDAIKVKGMEAYEKAAEVISGDPDENIIDTTSKNKRSRVAAGAAIGALALGVPTGLLAHRTAKKGIGVLNGARMLAESQGIDLGAAAAALREARAAGPPENFFKRKGMDIAHRVMAGPFKKVPLKLNALPGAAAGVVGAGAGAISGHEYDHEESRAVGRTKDEVDVRGHRIRRIGTGVAAGAALGIGHQLLHARKNPMRIKIPLKEIGEMVDSAHSPEIRAGWERVRGLGIPSEIAHPFALETRAARAAGATGLGGAAGFGYDMGVRSGYDDQETEFDTDSGNRASPATIFNVAGAAVPTVASSMVPIPGFLKPKPKTMAIAGGIGGLMNIVGRFRGRKISETARSVEKNSSVREYGQLFSAITDGQLGVQAQAALEGIHEVAVSSFQKKAETDIFTDGMDEKSRRRRLAELLKRREATGTASGSASPNPPQET